MAFKHIPKAAYKDFYSLRKALRDHKSDLPVGRSGDWEVSKFSVTKEDVLLSNMRLIMDGAGYRTVDPGSYTRLSHKSTIVMSDTKAEKIEHYPALEATGNVLITGLGMGMILPFILCNPAVTAVTVIEKSPDVIKLSAAHFAHPKLTVIEADAYEWRPSFGTAYDFCWHDVWSDLCGDNLPLMAKLTRKFSRYGRPIQDCWGRDYLRRKRRRSYRYGGW